MSPRIKTVRKVLNPPIIKGLKPYGLNIEKSGASHVTLLYEEYEALRLCDYDLLNHIQASEAMGISRPTFTRIYGAARQKVALALVEGRQLTIEGGKVYFDSDWYECQTCGSFSNNPHRTIAVSCCPLCKSKSIKQYEQEAATADSNPHSCFDICVCPKCGHELPHQQGIPCGQEVCPLCHTHMIKKNKRCKSNK